MQKAYNIQDSQAVSDPSTNWTQRCLTCQIGRDGVHSTWYGRKHHIYLSIPILTLLGIREKIETQNRKMPPTVEEDSLSSVRAHPLSKYGGRRGPRLLSAARFPLVWERAESRGLITQVWGKHWNWPKEIWR